MRIGSRNYDDIQGFFKIQFKTQLRKVGGSL
jgi:hypothetical protein